MNFVGISGIFVHLETEEARIFWEFLGFLYIRHEFRGNF